MGKIDVDLNNVSVRELVERLNESYTERFGSILLGLYHKFVNDALTTDDFEEIGKKHGIDLEQLYFDAVLSSLEDEDE